MPVQSVRDPPATPTTGHCPVKALDVVQAGSADKRIGLPSDTICVAHAVTSSQTHFYFLLGEKHLALPLVDFSA